MPARKSGTSKREIIRENLEDIIYAYDFEHDGWRLNNVTNEDIDEIREELKAEGLTLTKEDVEHLKRIKEIVKGINKLGREFWKEIYKFK